MSTAILFAFFARVARGERPAPPPPDHEGFVEVRALGFRAMRRALTRRRKA